MGGGLGEIGRLSVTSHYHTLHQMKYTVCQIQPATLFKLQFKNKKGKINNDVTSKNA